MLLTDVCGGAFISICYGMDFVVVKWIRSGEENARYEGSSYQRYLIHGHGEKQPMYFDNLNWSMAIYIGYVWC